MHAQTCKLSRTDAHIPTSLSLNSYLKAQVLPGDLSDLKSNYTLYLTLPTWAQFVLCDLKYGPVRALFVKAFKACRSQVNSAQRLHAILAQTVKRLHGVKLGAWSANLSVGVAHHSGWLPLLQKIGFLKKVVGQRGCRKASKQRAKARCTYPGSRSCKLRQFPASGLLHLGELQQWYRIVPCANIKLQKSLTDILNMGMLSPVATPRTLKDWAAASDKLMALFTANPSLTGPKRGYSQLWLARSFLFLQRQALPQRSQVLACDASAFHRVFPDQLGWIRRLCSRQSLKAALSELKYNGPLELFTMKQCMYANPQVEWVCEVDDHLALLRRLLRAYITEHGISPHPAVLQRIAKSQVSQV